MFFKDAIGGIVGKRVTAVVIGEKDTRLHPGAYWTQVCLVLDDGNHYELFGKDFQGCGSLDAGGIDAAVTYIRKTGDMNIQVLK
jgi:hypothetical protein